MTAAPEKKRRADHQHDLSPDAFPMPANYKRISKPARFNPLYGLIYIAAVNELDAFYS